MAYYPSRYPVRRGFGRPLTVRASHSPGLTFMFVLVLVCGFLVARSAAQSLELGTPNASKLSRTLGYGTPERLVVGYDPNAPSGSAAAEAPSVTPPVIQAPPAPLDLSAPAAAGAPAAVDRMRVAKTDGVGVVLHTAPRKDARVPRGLLEGTQVTVLERSGDEWARVRADNGQEGWVPSQYLVP